MHRITSLILGGGRGARLYPLTKFRSKPAVPLAGKYRLIDIPISNCLNSGINRIYVLTQFHSTSLHRHISNTYKFDAFSQGFVEILAAQQTLERSDWYQGTADAVRQNLRTLEDRGTEYILVLSGDQLYSMDFQAMLDTHRQSRADVTIATLPVSRAAAEGFGIMQVDATGRVQGFVEKPKMSEDLSRFRAAPAWLGAGGGGGDGREYLASMGIYLFRRDVLVNLLVRSPATDFGKELFPSSIRTHHAQAHLFTGYWEDIGTIKSFMHANLDLASESPPFLMDAPGERIFTRPRFLPPSRVLGATIDRTLIADGCVIAAGCRIENSVIGLRCRIGPGVTVRNSVIMGADFYESAEQIAAARATGVPAIGIDAGSVIEGAIVDKNCRIGRDVRVMNSRGLETSEDSPEAVVREGILVVPKEATLRDAWRF